MILPRRSCCTSRPNWEFSCVRTCLWTPTLWHLKLLLAMLPRRFVVFVGWACVRAGARFPRSLTMLRAFVRLVTAPLTCTSHSWTKQSGPTAHALAPRRSSPHCPMPCVANWRKATLLLFRLISLKSRCQPAICPMPSSSWPASRWSARFKSVQTSGTGTKTHAVLSCRSSPPGAPHGILIPFMPKALRVRTRSSVFPTLVSTWTTAFSTRATECPLTLKMPTPARSWPT
mmetsp:Transcript_12736/g.29301  ORF Transcript_12736/g.29301 Transcript_12736/m.29301 type:complete len:230 (+) Transcript_12736:226-915(+)